MMNWSPHITVAAVLERDNKFLFVEEKVHGQLVINQPAGHWEQGETLLDATVRETLEETAWHYEPTSITGIYQWRHPQTADTYLRFCFTGKLIEHDAHRVLDTDIEQAVWLTHEELKLRHKQHRSSMVQLCIEDYLKGQRFDLSILQSG
jgi:ADP-ribose pyrophosphatase YjhB (NUDIX family)